MMKNSDGSLRQSMPFQIGGWQILALPLVLFLAIPLIGLMFQVPYRNLMEILKSQQAAQAVNLSLFTSFLSVGIILFTGTPLAYWLAQRRTRLSRLIETLVELPTVLPPAVAGIALLMAFGRHGIVGSGLNALGITLPFTPAAVILAQVFIACPLFIKTAVIGFSGVNIELKQAAALDGANAWQIFQYVGFPLARLSLLNGSALAWARALGEFGATIIFAGNYPGRTQTMPLAIYLGFEIDLEVALALSFVMIGFSVVILLLIKRIFYTSEWHR